MTSDRAVAPVRLAIVGAGGIAKTYAEILGGAFAVPARAVGVVDVDVDAAAAMADGLGVPHHASAEALLEAVDAVDDLDAVVVCTPPNTHPAMVDLFTGRGVHVLCEKPLAVDAAQARAMVELAAGRSVVLAMATKFRYCQDIVTATEMARAGTFGELRLVENAFTSRVDMSNRWNSNPEISGGGVLVDNGTHSVDLLRYVLGPLTELIAIEQARPSSMRVDDCVRVHLRSESGVDASVDLAWSIDKSLGDFLKIFGTEGEARIGWRESGWRHYGGEWHSIGPGYAKHPAMGGALAQFCLAVRGVEPVAVTGDDAIAAACAIDAAYDSLRSGGWSKIALVP